jgi:hypothetical protein
MGGLNSMAACQSSGALSSARAPGERIRKNLICHASDVPSATGGAKAEGKSSFCEQKEAKKLC